MYELTMFMNYTRYCIKRSFLLYFMIKINAYGLRFNLVLYERLIDCK